MAIEKNYIIEGGLVGLREEIEKRRQVTQLNYDTAHSTTERAKYYHEVTLYDLFLALIGCVREDVLISPLTASEDLTVIMKREYLRMEGSVCPFCKSSDIEGSGSFDHDVVISQTVKCKNCGAEWSDTYTLTDLEHVQSPLWGVNGEGPFGWNDEHTNVADSQGWNLFATDNCQMIQRDDEKERFTSDEEAIEFVKRQAAAGDATAKVALVYDGYYRKLKGERCKE